MCNEIENLNPPPRHLSPCCAGKRCWCYILNHKIYNEILNLKFTTKALIPLILSRVPVK